MLERFHNYINDEEFRLTLYENKIHIINFKRIITLEEDYISLQNKNQRISIIGKNLILNKLLDREILIKGTIIKIEVTNE